LLSGGDQPQRQRAVPRDVAVLAGLEARGRDRILRVERLDGLAVVVAGLESADVGLGQGRALGETRADGQLLALGVARVDPEHQPERVEVLAAAGVLGADAGALDRLDDQLLEIDLDDAEAVDGAVGQWVRLPAGALQIALLEGGLVEDEQPAALEIAEVDLERGGVHRHQRVGLIAGREHLVGRELDLVARDAGGGARGCADFRRIVGERGEIVAVQRGLAGELRSGELHAVAGISREAHHGMLDVACGSGCDGLRH